ncbi:hypothetical protein POTTS_213 [Klebsiella phage vB_KpnM_Potts1]|uniref:Uncharacterized protein n=1 Tax=Klebsiella phage vB_KpnM_Potts1 TaxID=2591366 RepID=A0A5B9NJP8_9CAUD|nr:hypothetical protein POTTS_213 [Klebsiella phage vB_KpnM_Potts1]
MIPVSNGFNHGEIQLIMAGLPKSGFHLKILKKRLEQGDYIVMTNFESSIDLEKLKDLYAL